MANKVKKSMSEIYNQFGVDYEIHVSKVNSEGAKILE